MKNFLNHSKFAFLAAGLLIAGTAAFSGVAGAAKPGDGDTGSIVGEKVTICHRTNALTNPYVTITIDPDAILNEKGHGPQNTEHNRGTGIFDPDFNYPSNAKDWQDIIPPFDYTEDGVAKSFPGFNWTELGQAIWEADCDGYTRLDATTTTSGGDDGSTTTTSPSELPRNGVRVTVYIDLNDNCQQDDGEPTVPTVSVEVSSDENSYDLETDSSGTVLKGPIPGGTYTGTVTSGPDTLDVTCTDEDTTDVTGREISDIRIGLRGTEDISIDIDPPTDGTPPPNKIIIQYCGEDDICDTDDDLEFEVEVDEEGKYSASGLPSGRYVLRPMGTAGASFASIDLELTAESGELKITPVTVAAEEELANSGSGSSAQFAAALLMVLGGGALVLARRRRPA